MIVPKVFALMPKTLTTSNWPFQKLSESRLKKPNRPQKLKAFALVTG